MHRMQADAVEIGKPGNKGKEDRILSEVIKLHRPVLVHPLTKETEDGQLVCQVFLPRWLRRDRDLAQELLKRGMASPRFEDLALYRQNERLFSLFQLYTKHHKER